MSTLLEQMEAQPTDVDFLKHIMVLKYTYLVYHEVTGSRRVKNYHDYFDSLMFVGQM